MIKMDKKNSQKMPINYICELCNFRCSKKSNYEQHISTTKHKMIKIKDKKIKENAELWSCECGQSYKYQSGLSRHKNICKDINATSGEQTCKLIEDNIINKNNTINLASNYNNDEIKTLTNLIIEVVKNNSEFQKQNQEFQIQMFEVLKNNSSITNTNMYNCNNQNNFNLQLFLNETCKDAMNMSDFINSFNLQTSDLERLADDGYVKTMSNLIINKVRELDTEKRPIHCSDAKREVVYIKEDDVWIKDDEEKSNLRKAVNKIGCRNIGVLQDWQQAHPNCIKSNSPYNDIYLKMMKEVLGGSNISSNENKVIKNIIKEVVIDKQQYLK